MAKSKDRVLLEKIINTIDKDTYESLCEDGQDLVNEISKHVKIDLGFYNEVTLSLNNVDIDIPAWIDPNELVIEAKITHKNKEILTTKLGFSVDYF